MAAGAQTRARAAAGSGGRSCNRFARLDEKPRGERYDHLTRKGDLRALQEYDPPPHRASRCAVGGG